MATKTKPVVNLFAAGTKVKDTTAKKSDKATIKTELLSDQVQQFLEIKNRIEADTAKLKMLEGEIKQAGKSIFLKQYTSQKLRPESFKIQDGSGASCLFMVMDKYTMVDEDKASTFDLLNAGELLDSKTVYTMNAEMVEKYGQVLSDMIVNSKQIADEDKGQIITGELSYSVAKGSIERLMQYENPEGIFELINPIVALKK